MVWVAPLEVPRTEMVSLQVLVDRYRHSGIQKQRRKPGSSTQGIHWETCFRKWRGFWYFGWRGFGVDLLGQGKN